MLSKTPNDQTTNDPSHLTIAGASWGSDGDLSDSLRSIIRPLSLNVFHQSQRRRKCVSNTRRIEVTLLYTTHIKESAHKIESLESDAHRGSDQAKVFDTKSEIQEVGTTDLRHNAMPFSETLPRETTDVFRFLDLPIELRLKIYGYLLPARNHTIVTQIPHNGFFYHASSIPSNSASSFFPFGQLGVAPSQAKYTTYKVLNTNFRTDFPSPSIEVQLFLVSKKILAEAEPVLYGNNGTMWDFGIYLDALVAFWSDRSVVARRCVRRLKIARQIPDSVLEMNAKEADPLWVMVCEFFKEELIGLRNVDLTMWSSNGSATAFPSANPSDTFSVSDPITSEQLAIIKQKQVEASWREWEWTEAFLTLPALQEARITWWGLQKSDVKIEGEKRVFDAWVAAKMVGDDVVRSKMLRNGSVVEGVVLLRGLGA